MKNMLKILGITLCLSVPIRSNATRAANGTCLNRGIVASCMGRVRFGLASIDAIGFPHRASADFYVIFFGSSGNALDDPNDPLCFSDASVVSMNSSSVYVNDATNPIVPVDRGIAWSTYKHMYESISLDNSEDITSFFSAKLDVNTILGDFRNVTLVCTPK